MTARRWWPWSLLAGSALVWSCALPGASNVQETTTGGGAGFSVSVSVSGAGGGGHGPGVGGAGGAGGAATTTTTGAAGAGGAGGAADGCTVQPASLTVESFDDDVRGLGFCMFGSPSAFTVANGELNIHPAGNTGWWSEATKTIPPWLTKRVGAGQDFAALTTVEVLAPAAGIYQVGGLVVRTGTFDALAPSTVNDAEHWLKVEIGRISVMSSFGTLVAIKRAGQANAQWLAEDSSAGVQEAGLGVCRIGGTLHAFFDTVGPSFTNDFSQVQLGGPAANFDGVVEIGMTGGDWNTGDTDARFDVFALQLVDLTTANDCQAALATLGAGL